MTVELLSALATILLALSLAVERAVTIAKGLWPWLAIETVTSGGETDLVRDRWRRLAVQATAILCGWITAGFLVQPQRGDTPQLTWNLLGFVQVGSGSGAFTLPVLIVGVLASGGSALWSNVVGYTKAVKDAKNAEKASTNLSYITQAQAAGVAPPVKVSFDRRTLRALDEVKSTPPNAFASEA